MKNRFIESQIAKAKQYHRNRRGDQFDEGVLVRHSYDKKKSTDLSYWDDAAFIINNYRVALWWVHPRMRFADLVQEQAFKVVVSPQNADASFKNSTPNYKKVGRSRKKIVSYTLPPTKPEMHQYYEAIRLAEKDIAATASLEVRPTMNVKWYSWCKGIDLCIPFEVRSSDDLKQLVMLARKLLTRETTIQKEFGDYVYTRADWLQEQPPVWIESAFSAETDELY